MVLETKLVKLKDGRNLAYVEFGDLNGKPLFYFHGWPATRLSGKETDSAAKQLGIRVISPDRPGYGLSDYKPDRKLLDWPDDVIELADQLSIGKFAVVGVSGGGPYAAVCAYKIPERLINVGIIVGLAPTSIKGILDGIAFNGRFGWKYYHFSLVRKLSALGAMLQYRYFPFLGRLIGFQAKEDRVLLRSDLKERMENTTKEAFRQGFKGPELDLKIYTDNWGFNLHKIEVPVYLWYGAKDKNVSLAMGRYYESQIPNSKLFIDPTGGHLSRNNFEDEILKTLFK